MRCSCYLEVRLEEARLPDWVGLPSGNVHRLIECFMLFAQTPLFDDLISSFQVNRQPPTVAILRVQNDCGHFTPRGKFSGATLHSKRDTHLYRKTLRSASNQTERPIRWCLHWDSNPEHRDFKSPASANWAMEASS